MKTCPSVLYFLEELWRLKASGTKEFVFHWFPLQKSSGFHVVKTQLRAKIDRAPSVLRKHTDRCVLFSFISLLYSWFLKVRAAT